MRSIACRNHPPTLTWFRQALTKLAAQPPNLESHPELTHKGIRGVAGACLPEWYYVGFIRNELAEIGGV
jgi:glucose-6-phosphate dehydrogenase assembly protein OpcA